MSRGRWVFVFLYAAWEMGDDEDEEDVFCKFIVAARLPTYLFGWVRGCLFYGVEFRKGGRIGG